MTDERPLDPMAWERLEALWEAAANVPRGQRDEWLDAQGVHGALRDEITSLLAHADTAGEFFGRLQAVASDAAPSPAQAEPSSTDASDDDPAADPLIGSTVAHYRIDARLGKGGMGIVYRATDVLLHRPVALKLLRTQVPGDAHAKARMIREARAAASLDDVNICTIYEVGETADGRPYIAMAFYSGETLEQVLRRGPLPPSTVIDYATQIARGLAAAHRNGIIHRDVKPANVVVTSAGTLKLLDFGIAKLMDVTASHEAMTPGTISYMSPEQVTGHPLDPRADLWSLGIVIYEMCTGERPFVGAQVGAILDAIVREAPRPISSFRTDVPARLDAIVAHLLAKNPKERHAGADALVSDLTSIVDAPQHDDERGSRLPRRAAWYAAAVVVVLAAFAAVWPATRGPAVSERRLAAQELYDQGHRDVLFRTEGGRREALTFFRQAIAVDSTYATAHAGLAHLLVLISDNAGRSRRTQLKEAEAAARTAVRLDNGLADAHASLGHVLLFDLQLAEAEAEFKRAVALDPKTPYVREFLVWLYVFLERPGDALAEAQRAVADNPDSPTAIAEEARALLVSGRCGEAMTRLERLAYLTPPPARIGAIAAQCHAQIGRWKEAVDAVRTVAEQSPLQGNPWLAFMLARAGDGRRGRELRDTLLAPWGRGEGGAYGVALAYAGLRERDSTFAWLDRAIEDRSLRYNIMEPAFSELRRDLRFASVRRKLGIEGRRP